METEDTAELDAILSAIDHLELDDDDDRDDSERFGLVDEDCVHIFFPEEAGALYGVTGMTIPIATILDLLAQDSTSPDASLFRAIRKDFHPGDERHEFYTDCHERYTLSRGGPSISMAERAGIRLAVDAQSASMKEMIDGQEGVVALEELWAPFATERQLLLEEREELTERWQKLERNYADFILQKETKASSTAQDDVRRGNLDEEHQILLAQSREWTDRYDRLWRKIHHHAGIFPFPALPQDWFWNIAWSPSPQPLPDIFYDGNLFPAAH